MALQSFSTFSFNCRAKVHFVEHFSTKLHWLDGNCFQKNICLGMHLSINLAAIQQLLSKQLLSAFAWECIYAAITRASQTNHASQSSIIARASQTIHASHSDSQTNHAKQQ
ncbi:hypothetical protein U1Q18_039800 [Sarracenia purpurea var. burkii]